MNNSNSKIHFLARAEYLQAYNSPPRWYGYPRGFAQGEEIYINTEAYYFDERDFNLLIEHEGGHVKGKEHTWFGVMSAYGLIRYVTAPGLVDYVLSRIKGE